MCSTVHVCTSQVSLEGVAAWVDVGGAALLRSTREQRKRKSNTSTCEASMKINTIQDTELLLLIKIPSSQIEGVTFAV